MTRDRATADGAGQAVGIEVHPVAGHIGAEITGVDLAGELDDAVVAVIRAAVLRWKVVFFRGSGWTTPGMSRSRGGSGSRSSCASGAAPPRRTSPRSRRPPTGSNWAGSSAWSTTNGCADAGTRCCAAGTATTVPVSTRPPRRSCAPRPYPRTAATRPGRTWRRPTPDSPARYGSSWTACAPSTASASAISPGPATTRTSVICWTIRSPRCIRWCASIRRRGAGAVRQRLLRRADRRPLSRREQRRPGDAAGAGGTARVHGPLPLGARQRGLLGQPGHHPPRPQRQRPPRLPRTMHRVMLTGDVPVGVDGKPSEPIVGTEVGRW